MKQMMAETGPPSQADTLAGMLALGTERHADGDKQGAQEAFARAVAVAPDDAQANNNLGTSLLERGDLAGAAECFRRALLADPHYAIAANNLGTVFDAAQDPGTAEEWFALARDLDPAYLEPNLNLAASCTRRGAWAQARAHLDAAHGLAPDDPRVRWNLGVARLRGAEFAAGWPLYEAGIGIAGYRGVARSHPRHALSAHARRVLLWGEQGIGEQILYASMVPDLAARGIGGTIEVDPRLVPLFARSFPRFDAIAATSPPSISGDDFDAAMPLGSLGGVLRPHLAAFPRHGGYLRPDRARVAELRRRYATLGRSRIVGIAWMSGARSMADAKSIDLAALAPLLRVPDTLFVSLQYGHVAEQVDAAEQALGVRILLDPTIDQLRDLEGFAAQIAAMDHVVTISSAAAHLAGAIGRPGIVLLPQARGLLWHWLLERPDCPWYPSLTLLRQQRAGDWDAPIAEATRRLAEGRVHP